MLTYKTTQGLKDCEDAKLIREIVFIEEQGFKDEFDNMEALATHIVVYENDMPIATARFFAINNTEIFKIGRIAVKKEYRGQGIGKKIVEHCEEQIKSLGGIKVLISAQVRVLEFYESLGYVAVGDEYFEEHVAHIAMKKKL